MLGRPQKLEMSHSSCTSAVLIIWGPWSDPASLSYMITSMISRTSWTIFDRCRDSAPVSHDVAKYQSNEMPTPAEPVPTAVSP